MVFAYSTGRTPGACRRIRGASSRRASSDCGSVRNHLVTMLASTVRFTDPDLRGAGRRCRSGACRRSAMRSAEHARGIEGCGNEDSRAPSTRAGSHPRANADSLGLALEADRSHGRRCRRWSVWAHFQPDQLRRFINTLAWCKFRNNKAGILRGGTASAPEFSAGVAPNRLSHSATSALCRQADWVADGGKRVGERQMGFARAPASARGVRSAPSSRGGRPMP